VLKTNTALRSLHLGRNDIGDEGVQKLQQALRENSTLSSLWVPMCGLSDMGANHLLRMLCEHKVGWVVGWVFGWVVGWLGGWGTSWLASMSKPSLQRSTNW
jgi:hypothetical protein